MSGEGEGAALAFDPGLTHIQTVTLTSGSLVYGTA